MCAEGGLFAFALPLYWPRHRPEPVSSGGTLAIACEIVEFLADVRWLFVAAGIFLIVASVFGGGLEIRELKVPRLDKWPRLIAGAIGLAFLLLGLLVAVSPTVPPRDVEVAITGPPSGARVMPSEFVLRGTIRSSGDGPYQAAMLGQDPDGACYCWKSAYFPEPSGGWEVSLASVLTTGPAWHDREASVLVVDAGQYPSSRPGDLIDCPPSPLAVRSFYILAEP